MFDAFKMTTQAAAIARRCMEFPARLCFSLGFLKIPVHETITKDCKSKPSKIDTASLEHEEFKR